MPWEIRPIVEDEVAVFRHRLSRGFGGDLKEDDDEGRQRFAALFPLDRTRAAFDGRELVGTLGVLPLDLTVPGGTIPMAGTTMVTVQPTHRRRGVLRAMLADHLGDARTRGEPVAGLWASESSIYGRFGYGAASDRHVARIDTRTVRFVDDDTGAVRLVETAEAAARLPGIYDRLRRTRPGMLHRSPDHWRWRTLYDPEDWRDGASKLRFAVHSGPDGDDGYAVYRQKEKWDDFLAEGKVSVREVVTLGAQSHNGLWRFLTSIDLFPHVSYWNMPVDDELPWRIADPRRVDRALRDALWIRVLDVAAALAGRAYAVEGALRVGVVDEIFADNDGTYELAVRDGAAQCRRVSGDADIHMTAEALGAAYLGGRRLGALARTGRVHGTTDAVRKADGFFAWDPAPWCPEVF